MTIIENKLKEIMKDGKINQADIPHVVVIIAQTTNNLKSFNLTYNELYEVLEDIVLFILTHFKVVTEENVKDIKPIIHSCVDLIMLQPKVQNCFSLIWKKIKSCSCV